MPRQQSYHWQNTQRRSNQYYSALTNTGIYTSELNSAEAHHARNLARLQVVQDSTQDINVRREASRDLRQHGQSQTRRRVAPLATFENPTIKKTPLTIPKILITLWRRQRRPHTYFGLYTRATEESCLLHRRSRVRRREKQRKGE